MNLPRALVLTAGLGTRLRPLTYVRAKGAVPVNGEPLGRRVARWLAAGGVRDLVFNLHHRPESIASVLGDGSDLHVRVRYSWEDPVLGSAGGPRHALPLLTDGGAGDLLIVNGDTLTDVDVQAVVSEHRRTGAMVTLALIRNPSPAKYGGVLVSGDGCITGFTRPGTAEESHHFIGVQVADPRVFGDLPDGVRTESVGSVYPRLMESQPGSVRAYVCDAAFRDIGTPGDCLRTSIELAGIEGNRLISEAARIDNSAIVERSSVWDDVTVGANARLTECIVASGAVIPAGVTYERCAIVPAGRRHAASGERLENSLIVRPL